MVSDCNSYRDVYVAIQIGPVCSCLGCLGASLGPQVGFFYRCELFSFGGVRSFPFLLLFHIYFVYIVHVRKKI